MTNRPGGVFVYDSEDRLNPDEQSRAYYVQQDYRIYLVYILIGVLIALAFVGVHFWALYMITVANLATFGWLLLTLIYASLAVLIVSLAGICTIWLYNRAQKSGLFNVRQSQMHIGRMRDVSDRYFDVEHARASNVFGSAKNLTYGPHITYAGPRQTEQQTQQQSSSEEIQIMTLSELQERGLIARSGNSLLIGFAYDE